MNWYRNECDSHMSFQRFCYFFAPHTTHVKLFVGWYRWWSLNLIANKANGCWIELQNNAELRDLHMFLIANKANGCWIYLQNKAELHDLHMFLIANIGKQSKWLLNLIAKQTQHCHLHMSFMQYHATLFFLQLNSAPPSRTINILCVTHHTRFIKFIDEHSV